MAGDADRLARLQRETVADICVIANPPFSLDKRGSEVWASDPYGRNFAGMPPDSTGDCAWVQHMVKSMAPKTGRMAVVLPHGALFRIGVEGRIRQKLLGAATHGGALALLKGDGQFLKRGECVAV